MFFGSVSISLGTMHLMSFVVVGSAKWMNDATVFENVCCVTTFKSQCCNRVSCELLLKDALCVHVQSHVASVRF